MSGILPISKKGEVNFSSFRLAEYCESSDHLILTLSCSSKRKKISFMDIDFNSIRRIIIGKHLEFLTDVFTRECKYLEKVSFENSCFTKIDFGQFYHCRNLRKVILSPSIKVIDGCAFEGCASLKMINLENVRDIKKDALKDCILIQKGEKK